MNDPRALVIMYSCILGATTVAICSATMPQDTASAIDSVVLAAVVATVGVMLVKMTAGSMPSPDETFPQSAPLPGQRGSLTTARRMTDLVNSEANPQTVAQSASWQPEPNRLPETPPTTARASRRGPRSALSAPDNFVAEKAVRRIYHRFFGRRRWPVILFGSIALGAAAALVAFERVPGVSLRSILPQQIALRMLGPADTGARSPSQVDDRPAIQGLSEPAPAPQATPRPEAQDAGPAFQERLATSGVSPAATNAAGPNEVRVTAFPPAVAPEPVQPEEKPRAVEPEKPSGTKWMPAKPSGETRKLDALIARGQQLLAAGDVASARRYFARVASDGDPRGALGMARSYDERILRKLPVVGTEANASEAKAWYERAETLEAGKQAPGEQGAASER